MFARHFIDSLEFARNGRELSGEVPVAEMPRLQEKLADPEGKISYLIRGCQDKSGKPMLEVTMEGLCQLRCQRCLGGLAYPVNLVSRLILVQENELDEYSVEIEEDEPDSILADNHQDVLALVEEEILLSLPFAPKHPSGVCQLAAKDLELSGNPAFAVLAGLKDK